MTGKLHSILANY